MKLLNEAVAAAREVVTLVSDPKDGNFLTAQFGLGRALFNWVQSQSHRSVVPVIAALEEALAAVKKCSRAGGGSNPMLIHLKKEIKKGLKLYKKSAR